METMAQEKTLKTKIDYEGGLLKVLKFGEFVLVTDPLGNRYEMDLNNLKSSGAEIELDRKDHYSPMGGVLRNFFVEVGDPVKEGDALALVEAMKMQVEVNAKRDGVVTKILVKKQDSVQKGSLLVVIES